MRSVALKKLRLYQWGTNMSIPLRIIGRDNLHRVMWGVYSLSCCFYEHLWILVSCWSTSSTSSKQWGDRTESWLTRWFWLVEEEAAVGFTTIPRRFKLFKSCSIEWDNCVNTTLEDCVGTPCNTRPRNVSTPLKSIPPPLLCCIKCAATTRAAASTSLAVAQYNVVNVTCKAFNGMHPSPNPVAPSNKAFWTKWVCVLQTLLRHAAFWTRTHTK